MLRKNIIRGLVGLAVAIAAVLAVGWLAFVPLAKEPGYAFQFAWGEKGSQAGQFFDPTGIAVTADEVFVADARNARIQVFDFDGNFKRRFGERGEEPGQLGRRMNLVIVGDEIYVADYWNDRVEIFGLDGTPRRTIGRPGRGPGEFDAPGGIAVGDNGDLFIADFYNQRVQQLRADGGFIRQWGTTRSVGIWAGEFNYPTDVALSRDGTLYVADGYNDRVQAFAKDGRYLHKWGGPFAMNIFGPFNGWFATTTSIALDKDSNVFVADFHSTRLVHAGFGLGTWTGGFPGTRKRISSMA